VDTFLPGKPGEVYIARRFPAAPQGVPREGVLFAPHSYNNPVKYVDPSGHGVKLPPLCPSGCPILRLPKLPPLAKILIKVVASVTVDAITAGRTGFYEGDTWGVIPDAEYIESGAWSVPPVFLGVAGSTDDIARAGGQLLDDAVEEIPGISPSLLEEATGQFHHIFSNKIMRTLDTHPALRGIFERGQAIVQALNREAHIGYQHWHRIHDDEVVEWISNPTNLSSTRIEFLDYMKSIYRRPEISWRFPKAEDVLDKLIEYHR
jgi:hypothetical protein